MKGSAAIARLRDKIAVIIGAGQSPGESVGNGRATAIRFAQEGAKILAADRNLQSAQETVDLMRKYGGDYTAIHCDVTDSTTIKAAVDFAMGRWGRIDILHYNVGVSVAGGDSDLEHFEEAAFDRVMHINLRGAIMAAKFVQPIMRAQRSGVVINVASMTAIETQTPNVAYRASKAGMIAFTEQFAIHNAPYGVRANAILPGMMETSMAVDTRARMSGRSTGDIIAERNAKVPLRNQGGTGWDVANAALYLASDEANFVTGVSLPVEGGALVKIGW
jgi:NAD(P)-dependent dehydrogenase (short-subunit alcohol dehydrogenase family)